MNRLALLLALSFAVPAAAQGVSTPSGNWLGLVVQDLDGEGVMVQQVLPGSPASSLGLQAGDIVLQAASHRILDSISLGNALSAAPAGAVLELIVLRGSQLSTVAVGPRPPPAASATASLTPLAMAPAPVAVTQSATAPVAAAAPAPAAAPALVAATPAAWPLPATAVCPPCLATPESARLGMQLLEQPWGVTVISVRGGTPADRAGVRAGDVLLQAGRGPVVDVASLERTLLQTPGSSLRLKLLRRGQTRWRRLRLDGME